MPGRRLAPDEAALWRRVMESVRPLAKRPPPAAPLTVAPHPAPGTQRVKAPPRTPIAPVAPPVAKKTAPGSTLDGGWDRRLTRGLVSPDSSIDLHGHSLASAYRLLDEGLDHALRRGDRVLLLVTGKPPRAESERPHARGAIRAAVGDWIAGSLHAGRIAAVRGAHPRHGGLGALYIVLRRDRGVS